MSAASLKEQIMYELDRLTREQQEQLLDMARRLQGSVLPSGTSGNVLLAHMDGFDFAPGAVDEIMRAIDDNCEEIDWDGWQ